jgi:hypothetical protein
VDTVDHAGTPRMPPRLVSTRAHALQAVLNASCVAFGNVWFAIMIIQDYDEFGRKRLGTR